jgi:hypothetical protein
MPMYVEAYSASLDETYKIDPPDNDPVLTEEDLVKFREYHVTMAEDLAEFLNTTKYNGATDWVGRFVE